MERRQSPPPPPAWAALVAPTRRGAGSSPKHSGQDGEYREVGRGSCWDTLTASRPRDTWGTHGAFSRDAERPPAGTGLDCPTSKDNMRLVHRSSNSSLARIEVARHVTACQSETQFCRDGKIQTLKNVKPQCPAHNKKSLPTWRSRKRNPNQEERSTRNRPRNEHWRRGPTPTGNTEHGDQAGTVPQSRETGEQARSGPDPRQASRRLAQGPQGRSQASEAPPRGLQHVRRESQEIMAASGQTQWTASAHRWKTLRNPLAQRHKESHTGSVTLKTPNERTHAVARPVSHGRAWETRSPSPLLLQSQPETELKRSEGGDTKGLSLYLEPVRHPETHRSGLSLTSRTRRDFKGTRRGRHGLRPGVQRGLPPGAPSRAPPSRPGQTGLGAQPGASRLPRLGLGESRRGGRCGPPGAPALPAHGRRARRPGRGG